MTKPRDNPDDPHWVYLPLDKLTDAQGDCNVWKDRWWAVHPERGLLFYDSRGKRRDVKYCSPQCNAQEATCRLLNDKLHPWAEVRQIPLVITHMDPRVFDV